jgi:hypothetical protein
MSKNDMGRQLQQLFVEACCQIFNVVSIHIFSKLGLCHTALNGMHCYKCSDSNCNHIHHQYHSCGNRHCPNCGGLKKEVWIDKLLNQLLPTNYYHIVFTVPHEFNSLTLGNRSVMFKLLFDAGSETLLQLSNTEEYLGATCGITSILHTWGQNLSFHPHIHCIVSGGGIKDNKWVKPKRTNGKFLFPQKVLQTTFKAIYLKKLRKLLATGQLKTEGIAIEKLIKETGFKQWNVYAKSSFGSVENVVKYLGRYTHKIAITKHRIISISDYSVSFKWRDYADSNKEKIMTLSKIEFLHRFELHFLPARFVKIRHYGYMQNHGKSTRLNALRATMDLQPMQPVVHIPVAVRMLEKYGEDITQCPVCKEGSLVLIAIIYPGIDAKLPNESLQTKAVTLRNKASPTKKQQV